MAARAAGLFGHQLHPARHRDRADHRAPLSAWPLGEGLSYGPPPGPAVATERCPWRGRVLKGEVHDENASAMGGETGHAGLFGTVAGVLDFARGLLDGSGASPAMLEAIRTPFYEHRTCGWERRFAGWSGGQACSAETIGHTGFTGTGLWVDFERGLAWTLLTNRVHPTRHCATSASIFTLRPATGDAVIAAWDATTAALVRRRDQLQRAASICLDTLASSGMSLAKNEKVSVRPLCAII